jgi:hypothetical protein
MQTMDTKIEQVREECITQTTENRSLIEILKEELNNNATRIDLKFEMMKLQTQKASSDHMNLRNQIEQDSMILIRNNAKLIAEEITKEKMFNWSDNRIQISNTEDPRWHHTKIALQNSTLLKDEDKWNFIPFQKTIGGRIWINILDKEFKFIEREEKIIILNEITRQMENGTSFHHDYVLGRKIYKSEISISKDSQQPSPQKNTNDNEMEIEDQTKPTRYNMKQQFEDEISKVSTILDKIKPTQKEIETETNLNSIRETKLKKISNALSSIEGMSFNGLQMIKEIQNKITTTTSCEEQNEEYSEYFDEIIEDSMESDNDDQEEFYSNPQNQKPFVQTIPDSLFFKTTELVIYKRSR